MFVVDCQRLVIVGGTGITGVGGPNGPLNFEYI
jgi:hypothetical protein